MEVVYQRCCGLDVHKRIAELLQHGLLRGSFIPDRPQRDLREPTRYRMTLVQEGARVVQRVQKVLEDTNLKLASVVTDITGVSARAMLEALLAGQADPASLVQLAKGRLRQKREELERALAGVVRAHHCRLVARRGKKKALVAVGHSILIIAYHVLTQKTPYRDLGPNYFDDHDRLRVQHRLTKRLEPLGYRVTLDPLTAVA